MSLGIQRNGLSFSNSHSKVHICTASAVAGSVSRSPSAKNTASAVNVLTSAAAFWSAVLLIIAKGEAEGGSAAFVLRLHAFQRRPTEVKVRDGASCSDNVSSRPRVSTSYKQTAGSSANWSSRDLMQTLTPPNTALPREASRYTMRCNTLVQVVERAAIEL